MLNIMFCSSCGATIGEGSRFCTSCGAPTGNTNAITSGSYSQSLETPGEGAKTRSYIIDSENSSEIVSKVENWLSISNDFEVQKHSLNETEDLLQIRKKGQWRRFVGMSTALSIQFTLKANNLKVSIGQAHWLGKVASGGVSWFVLWPLAVTTAVGVYEQAKTPEKIFDYIDSIT
tara:strand:- start:553 stop:1077 length:525 start_codon:yes stop_codon:yes gene_type:complete